jgi:hypothetical protein
MTPNPSLMIAEDQMNQVTELLHGKEMKTREYIDLRTGQQVSKMHKENFFNILLNVSVASDIYSAWETLNHEIIDNYEHS